ncbi:hypothetical protein [Mesorhizobium kowhaii]|nr:hypothetical protein [Mesorhizobium kowhaii]
MKRKTAMWWVSAAITALPTFSVILPQVDELAAAVYLLGQGVTVEQLQSVTASQVFQTMSAFNPEAIPSNWDGYMFLLNSVVWSVLIAFGRRVLMAIWPDRQQLSALAPAPVALPKVVEQPKAVEPQLLDQIGSHKWRSAQ